MTPEPNSSQPNRPESNVTVESQNGASPNVPPESGIIVATAEPEKPQQPPPTRKVLLPQQPEQTTPEKSGSVLTLGLIAAMIFGLANDNIWLGLIGAVGAIGISLRLMWPSWGKIWVQVIPPTWRTLIVACFGLLAGIVGLLMLSGSNTEPGSRNIQINWDAIGALGELIGALGQILIAILGVYVAWRQYVISKDLTIQQNRITQQQTIDAYFQGVSDLALDEQGFLEDWPQERAIAEGRTAAIMSSVDAEGKAKILRFLSQSRLVTPLKRDRLLGRPILDGDGGYAEDRDYGIRVIDLNVMLAGANLAGTDLRWTDLSEANLVRANLSKCDLVKANLSRAVLYDANLARADMRGAALFYGSAETASPRSRTEFPNYQTGEHTGAVVERADFTAVKRLSDEQRYYCCAWCGSKSRETIPGGCEGIPNKLGR
ncbi:pentapeptide repeat-containing protein [Microcoleus sp. Pol10D4]|uniref:pentapeptide repeat-containing protein n=1 Tax=Microcoleus sp. Pol10D4 TaxID=3055387 RepID=UPI002FD4A9FE